MRMRAVRLGEWRATSEKEGVAGFHLSGLYSPFITLSQAVEEFQSAKGHPEILEHGSTPILPKAGKKNLNGLTPMILLNDVSNIRMRVQMAFWSSRQAWTCRQTGLKRWSVVTAKLTSCGFWIIGFSMALLLLMICGKNWLTTYWSRGLFRMGRISRLPRHWWTAVMKRKRCINSSSGWLHTESTLPKESEEQEDPFAEDQANQTAQKSQSFQSEQTKRRMWFLVVSRFRKLVQLTGTFLRRWMRSGVTS